MMYEWIMSNITCIERQGKSAYYLNDPGKILLTTDLPSYSSHSVLNNNLASICGTTCRYLSNSNHLIEFTYVFKVVQKSRTSGIRIRNFLTTADMFLIVTISNQTVGLQFLYFLNIAIAVDNTLY